MNTNLSEDPVPPAAAQPTSSQRAQQLADLLERARDGDRNALNELVVELSPLLWHVARSQGLGHEPAEDVVQTTWLTLLRSLDAIRTPTALVSWLVTVTKRESWRQRAATRLEHPDDERVLAIVDLDPEPEQVLIATEQDRMLWAAVTQLSARCRYLLRAIAFAPRLDYGTVAAALGMPRGAIGPTRGRCLAKLRVLLGGDWRSE